MYTPLNPSFTIQKWGLRGSKLYRYVFVMNGLINLKRLREVNSLVNCPFDNLMDKIENQKMLHLH